ncbi:hypothetical protein FRC12_023920 [Ceratobasidium sp. 428]|nr:hypothetical protein FRC12_023920 [Ceratobasidium sp. 428]
MFCHTQRGLKHGHVDPASNPHDPRLANVSRNRHIFPAGFGTPDLPNNGLATEFTLPQIEGMLIRQHSLEDHVEHIYVKSAEYCKGHDGPQHEFILVTVETNEDPRFRNYIILDRTYSLPAHQLVINTALSSSATPAKDRLRISYDGTLKPLLEHCSVSKYRVLETLEFQKMSFLLYELIVLSRAASDDRYRTHYALISQSYWYASLIWDCMRQLLPATSLVHTIHTKKNVRGKFGKVFHPRTGTDSRVLSTISEDVDQELDILRRKFADVQKNWTNQETPLYEQQQENAQLE